MKTKLDFLTNFPLLHPDQKLNIINQFIWPSIVYPLQSTPLNKIKNGFLQDLDRLIRSAVKQICRLPTDTPDAMIYSARKFRGLGVFRAAWEAFLQHLNIIQKLDRVDEPLLPLCRNFQEESLDCLRKLKIDNTTAPSSTTASTEFDNTTDTSSHAIETYSAKHLRELLRNREYSNWCALPSRGKGVEVFQEYPQGNKWVSERCGLSSSEWTSALKMSINDCNLRGNPRTASSTIHCRHCSEVETLAHVLGACPRGELLRNERHHKVCRTITDALSTSGYTVHREDHVRTEHGSRFSDLLVLDITGSPSRGYILDPTVRFERSRNQATEVDLEKRSTYDPTIPEYRRRYPNVQEWKVIGLLFGARGALPRSTVDVLTKTFRLGRPLLDGIIKNIIKDSIGILHHHIYQRSGGHG